MLNYNWLRFIFKQAVSQTYLYFPHFLWIILLSCHCLPGQNTSFVLGCCCACFNNNVFGRATILGWNFSRRPVHFVQISLIKSNQNSHHSTGQWISSVSLVLSKQKENHEGLDNLFLLGSIYNVKFYYQFDTSHLEKGSSVEKTSQSNWPVIHFLVWWYR